MEYLRCGHCRERLESLRDAYAHAKSVHEKKDFKIYKPYLCHETGKKKYRELDYKTKPTDDVSCLYFDDERMVITKEKAPPNTTTPSDDDFESSDLQDKKSLTDELLDLFPKVMLTLQEHGDLDTWAQFFRNVHDDTFPLDNISYQLFLDIVRWHDTDDKRRMRYSDEVKRFWATGLKLFRGKFLHFMGGYRDEKDISDVQCGNSINFACPDRKMLQCVVKSNNTDCQKPGILFSNIDTFCKDSTQKSYKLCIDGKKIMQGFGSRFGEVDLYGHESTPTLSQKRTDLEEELTVVQKLETSVNLCQQDGEVPLSQLAEGGAQDLTTGIIHNIKNLSLRLRQLRETKLKKENALDRLKDFVGKNWAASKYAYSISLLQTSLFRVKDAIAQHLGTINTLLAASAQCNKTSSCLSVKAEVNLTEQANFQCLPENAEEHCRKTGVSPHEVSHLIPQRTEAWHIVRASAKVTGSTLYTAIGCDTLKKQREFYEHRKKGTPLPEPPLSAKAAMEHGCQNEIHALGTLVAKVLPVLAPECSFFEEGCVVIKEEQSPFLVVSPDGSVRDTKGTVRYAVELKCPFPGKKYQTDLHYKIPLRYVTQLLSEMFALKCDKLLYLCYTAESSVVFVVYFDSQLWKRIYKALRMIYLEDAPPKSKDMSALVRELKADFKSFLQENVIFWGEVPSLKAQGCSHNLSDETPLQHLQHNAISNRLETDIMLTDVHHAAYKVRESLKEAYQIQRLSAKEVLVVMMSDLDRMERKDGSSSVPVAYGLSGYTLTTDSARSILMELLMKCKEKSLHIPVLSFDGQFLKIAVRDGANNPLTVLQLAKDVWVDTKRQTKGTLLKTIKETNRVPSCQNLENLQNYADVRYEHGKGFAVSSRNSQMWTPPNLLLLLDEGKARRSNSDSTRDECTETSVVDQILSLIPCDDLDEEVMAKIREISKLVKDTTTSISNEESVEDSTNHREREACGETVLPNVCDMIERIYQSLLSEPKTRECWSARNIDDLRLILRDSININKEFTKASTTNILKTVPSCVLTQKMTKVDLVNKLSLLVQNGTRLDIHTKKPRSPVSLRQMASRIVDKFPKLALNVIAATNIFPEKLREWKMRSPFKDSAVIGNDCHYVWYSQPEFVPQIQDYVLSLLDCHHLFVNARSTICSKGIPDLGISKEAWLQVAKDENQNKTGLNIAMVEDLVDRQSNAFARCTFSNRVEAEMRRLSFDKEADFCRDIRNWYEAEDEGGICAEQRFQHRMAMRRRLLAAINLGTFPPPGSHVRGMPITMFEGILTNIDRRLQLHVLAKGGVFNVRALGTLEVETFFSCFQAMDPNATGVLRADDVPKVMETASFLHKTKTDSSRTFSMRTSREAVYPLHRGQQFMETDGEASTSSSTLRSEHILLRDHEFDQEVRRKGRPKRKLQVISRLDEPARGTSGVRQHHRTDESKILPHKREGVAVEGWR